MSSPPSSKSDSVRCVCRLSSKREVGEKENTTTIVRRAVGESLSGVSGGVIASTIVYPLDVVKTRLQVSDVTDNTGILSSLTHIARNEGLAGLYSGLLSEYAKISVQNGIYFGSYSSLKQVVKPSNGLQLGVANNLAVGMLAGAITTLFTSPLSVVQTRQQTMGGRGLIHTLRSIVRDEGVGALYSGIIPSLILTTNPAIQFVVFDRLKTYWQRQYKQVGQELNAFELLIVGAIAKTVATLVTYPYIMAKVRLQHTRSNTSLTDRSHLGGSLPYTGTLDVLVRVLRREGITGVYKGMRAQIFKSVLGASLMFVCKEKLSSGVRTRLSRRQCHCDSNRKCDR